VGNNEQRREHEAAVQHYDAVSRPRDARDVAEGADDQGAVLRDEAAAKLRARGFSAREAADAVDAVMAVFGERDRQLAEAFCGAGDSDPGNTVLARMEAMESLRVMAIKLVQSPKPRFSAGCFLLGAGIDHDGVRSERQWAEAQGLSHTHACNEVREWQRLMRLPKTSAQKSERACSTYAETNGAQAKTNL
jgi:hypothetical protein